MSEHLLVDQMKRYLNREMKPAELLTADDHLAGCNQCFQQVADAEFARRTADLEFLQTSPDEAEHLSYKQLEDYVDEKPDVIGREIADVHLQVCGECKQELNGLIEMRKLIEANAGSRVSVPQTDERSIVNSIRDLFSGRYLPRFGFAALGVLLVISLFGAFWLLKPSKSTEIAVTSPPSNVGPTREQPPDDNNNAPQNTNSETDLPIPSPTPNELESLPPQYQAEIRRVLADGNLDLPPEIKQLNNQTGKLMSGGTAEVPFALSAPLGKIIQSNRPRFSWGALAGAEGYIVRIFDANFNPAATSPRVSATSWQIDKPLGRNKIYLWQVTAIKDGEEIKSPVRPAPDAKFKVLGANQADELVRLSRQYKNEHLFLGIVYAKAGLLDESSREFQKEINKNPKSETARKLLRNLRKQ